MGRVTTYYLFASLSAGTPVAKSESLAELKVHASRFFADDQPFVIRKSASLISSYWHVGVIAYASPAAQRIIEGN